MTKTARGVRRWTWLSARLKPCVGWRLGLGFHGEGGKQHAGRCWGLNRGRYGKKSQSFRDGKLLARVVYPQLSPVRPRREKEEERRPPGGVASPARGRWGLLVRERRGEGSCAGPRLACSAGPGWAVRWGTGCWAAAYDQEERGRGVWLGFSFFSFFNLFSIAF